MPVVGHGQRQNGGNSSRDSGLGTAVVSGRTMSDGIGPGRPDFRCPLSHEALFQPKHLAIRIPNG